MLIILTHSNKNKTNEEEFLLQLFDFLTGKLIRGSKLVNHLTNNLIDQGTIKIDLSNFSRHPEIKFELNIAPKRFWSILYDPYYTVIFHKAANDIFLEISIDFEEKILDFERNIIKDTLGKEICNIVLGDFRVFYADYRKMNDKIKKYDGIHKIICEDNFFELSRSFFRAGDFVLLNKPEVNLTPNEQRSMACRLAELANRGIKVIVITHSDYIVKEINTLIMLRSSEPRVTDIINTERYLRNTLLDIAQVEAYAIDYDILIPHNIDPEVGICIESWDQVIDTMNRIQDEIISRGFTNWKNN